MMGILEQVGVDDQGNHRGKCPRCTYICVVPEVISCTYDVGQADRLPLLVRRFTTDTSEVTMVIFGGTGAAIDYLSGSFTPYPVSDTAERWLTI